MDKQIKKTKCKFIMFRHEMESDPIIIGAWAHNKEGNKQNEGT